MAVTSQTSKVQYDCNGVQLVFPFAFRIFKPEDLTVILTSAAGVDTTLVYGPGYEVAAAMGGYVNGGTVTVRTAYATGNKLLIIRNLAYTQELDLQAGGAMPAESLEAAIDRTVLLTQQLAEESSRTLKIPATSGEEATPDALMAAMNASVLAAETAQGAAETAQGLAETAQGAAQTAAGAAQTAQGLAETAAEGAAAAAALAAAEAISGHEEATNPHPQYVVSGQTVAAYGVVKKDGTKLAGSSNWSVSKNSTGNYQLNITDAGSYIVIAGQSGVAGAGGDVSDTVSAHHSQTTGIFDNNASGNIQLRSWVIGADEDSSWNFIAIKVA